MPFAKGQVSNPEGARREKRFYAALERAVLADEGKLLRAAADKLLECAASGAPWAISLLADRLDGKAAQSIDMNIRRTAQEMEDAELLDLARRGSERAATEKVCETEPSSVH